MGLGVAMCAPSGRGFRAGKRRCGVLGEGSDANGGRAAVHHVLLVASKGLTDRPQLCLLAQILLLALEEGRCDEVGRATVDLWAKALLSLGLLEHLLALCSPPLLNVLC